MPVTPYSADELAWHRWEQQVVAVCGLVPVAAIYCQYFRLAHTGIIEGPLIFLAGAYRHYRGTTTVRTTAQKSQRGMGSHMLELPRHTRYREGQASPDNRS